MLDLNHIQLTYTYVFERNDQVLALLIGKTHC